VCAVKKFVEKKGGKGAKALLRGVAGVGTRGRSVVFILKKPKAEGDKDEKQCGARLQKGNWGSR